MPQSFQSGSEFQGPLLVDGHVHFHDCFALDSFLDFARANVRRGAATLGLSGDPIGCLLLTETASAHWFRRWSDRAYPTRTGGGHWSLRPGPDHLTIVAEFQGSARLVLVAGRQISTREGLEVLAVGSDQEFPDQRDFDSAIRGSAEAGALTIVPWGFGKWWLARGHLVRRAIETAAPGSLCLGDNGGRPGGLPFPRLLAEGRDRGILIIPGSDPLPFPAQVRRVGSFGFVLPEGGTSPLPSGRQVVQRIRALAGQPQPYGQLQSIPGFLAAQARMQWRKRVGARG